FSIGQGETVEFGGKDKNYLNIAHGTSKSMIEGLLNAGGNNVFLINPNGVIITKTGTINANRFVASTSSMSNDDMWKFAKLTKEQGASFSPVFKPQKAGNVVNMGNINANNVLLIGNKVSIDGGHINGKHNDNVSGDALKNPSGNTAEKIHLVGNEVYIDKDMAKFNSTSGKVDVTANAIYTQRQMINFANDGYKFGSEIKDKINITNYQNHKGNSNFKKALTIGNMGNEKDNAIEWWHFAKGWNEGLGNIREIDEFRLVDDIDFSGKEGKNYANYCIDGLGCTSMIVGVTSAFTKTFDGQDYTLRNINIDTTVDAVVDKPKYVGIFGVSSKGAIFKNINVDYERGINTLNAGYIGGFIGLASDALLSNIYLGNIENITAVTYDRSVLFIGGMIGFVDYSELSNISLDSIKNISGIAHGHSSFVSGLSGYSRGSSISNIFLNNIGNINSRSFAIPGYGGSSFASGFIAGIHSSSISNIYLDNIKNISASTLVGGFAGGISNSSISNIYLNNILNIIGIGNDVLSGGFVGDIGDSNFKNIYMFFASGVKIEGEQVGIFFGSSKGTNLNNIHIYHHENDLANATADQSYWGDTNNKIQIHTYNDNNQESVYKDFLSKANIIEKPNHSDVSLEEDDLNKEVIGQIIEDITQKGYVVDIAMLEKLLEVYSKFNLNTTESEKIAFIQTYFNIKDENEARGILQSLDFLTYYTKNETFDKNRISNEAKDLFISLQNQSETTLANNKALFSYLNDNKDKLIAEYNKYKELEQIFKDKEQDYFKA
ncbi:TPA: filamentous hemagglutinin N-terminal domain-containing protein, partial [Campylobacter lari]|nr:filamentous hemagglutinin N-terminal domain-containing protein [Campylobacter lari]